MSKLRQQLLILNLASPDLESRTVAWALYDGASSKDDLPMQSGDAGPDGAPIYPSVLAAMRDGWRVIQIPTLPYYVEGRENETGHLMFKLRLRPGQEQRGLFNTDGYDSKEVRDILYNAHHPMGI